MVVSLEVAQGGHFPPIGGTPVLGAGSISTSNGCRRAHELG